MTQRNRHKFLCIFGDGKGHGWFEIISMAVSLLKQRQKNVEEILHRCLEYGLLIRVRVTGRYQEDLYQLTERGDECFRMGQISLGGDYSYYRYFDRSINGKYGLDKYAPLSIQKVKR